MGIMLIQQLLIQTCKAVTPAPVILMPTHCLKAAPIYRCKLAHRLLMPEQTRVHQLPILLVTFAHTTTALPIWVRTNFKVLL